MARSSRFVRENPEASADPEDTIRVMPVAANKVFAFRADQETVSLLSAMPNASDFIRKAIARSLEEPCPVCLGRGVVAPGFREVAERLGGHFVLRRCDCCSAEFPAACDARPTSGTDRLRQELANRRGEWLCEECFHRAPACTKCTRPWETHSPADFVAHFRSAPCGRALVTRPRVAAAGRDGRPKKPR